MLAKNDEIIIDITDYTAEGNGVGRHEGMAIFVPLTAVGDRAEVKILKVKKTYAYAKLIRVISPSEDRCENDCPVFVRCGGCAYRHINYSAELVHKSVKVYETMKRIGGVDLLPETILSDSPARYRNKAQYPLSEEGKAGFYAFHSHRIIPCRDCRLQPEIFSLLTAAAEDWMQRYRISPYREDTHAGLVRHFYIRQAEKTGEIMFTAVINGTELPHSQELVTALLAVAGEQLTSVQLNVNRQDTNVILGETCRTLYGKDFITDVLCGLNIRLSPLSFYQVNRGMAERLYEKAAEYAQPENKTVLDLYCGAGTIGLTMAGRAKSIIGVEVVQAAVRDAKVNAAQNGITNARFLCGDAAEAAEQLAEESVLPDVVIVDPPRKGCSEELIGIVAERFCPERVVYVSCDPATLARDVKLFAEKGYALMRYTPADLFPRTSHVECVVLMSRVEGK